MEINDLKNKKLEEDKVEEKEIDEIKVEVIKEELEILKLNYEQKLEEISIKEKKMLRKEEVFKRYKTNIRKMEEEVEEEREQLENEKLKLRQEKIKIYKEAEEYIEKEINVYKQRNIELAGSINKYKNMEHEIFLLEEEVKINKKVLEEYKEEIRKDKLKIKEYESNYNLEEIRDLTKLKEENKRKDKEIKDLKNIIEELEKNNIDLEEKKQEVLSLKDNKVILERKLDKYRAQIRYIKRLEESKGSSEDNSQAVFEEIIGKQMSIDDRAKMKIYEGDKKFTEDFVKYCKACGFIYKETIVRNFLAAIKSSKMTILKGYSGTGKSSLPNLFANFVKGECVIIPVQPNWRTKQDILGFYNYFTNKFIPTEFTKALIRANVSKDRIFIIVLDEMNLARVEYYFSEFNSKLWLSEKEREIEIFEGNIEYEGIVGKYIKNNKVKIPDNVYFIGTINEDDSVSAISDKIFDRAQVVEFLELPNSESVGDLEKQKPKDNTYTKYESFIKEREEKNKKNNIEIIDKINEFIKENFNKVIGFRSLKQARKFVSLYMESGGERTEAIDLQLVSKFMPKLKFIYSDEQIDALEFLIEEIKEAYRIEFNLEEEKIENLNIIKQLNIAIKELRD